MTEPEQMAPLTKEQKEYLDLKIAINRMMNYRKKLMDECKISQCHRINENQPSGVKFIFESLFYDYMAVLEKEQEKPEEK